MGRKIEFTISGEPVAQGRPRFSNHGGFVKAYDPAKSRNGKQHVRYAAKHAMEGETPLLGPLHLRAEFGIMMPKSQARKRTPRTREYRVKKPDLDNLLKLVKDGCGGVVYLDDNTVVMITARKIQCAQDEAPFTRVSFEELEELSDASS